MPLGVAKGNEQRTSPPYRVALSPPARTDDCDRLRRPTPEASGSCGYFRNQSLLRTDPQIAETSACHPPRDLVDICSLSHNTPISNSSPDYTARDALWNRGWFAKPRKWQGTELQVDH